MSVREFGSSIYIIDFCRVANKKAELPFMALTKSYSAVRLSVCIGPATFCLYLTIDLALAVIVSYITNYYNAYKYLVSERKNQFFEKKANSGTLHFGAKVVYSSSY